VGSGASTTGGHYRECVSSGLPAYCDKGWGHIAQQAAVESLVRKLLDAKGQGPQVAEWERELNGLVYELYGLADGEIAIVEESVPTNR